MKLKLFFLPIIITTTFFPNSLKFHKINSNLQESYEMFLNNNGEKPTKLFKYLKNNLENDIIKSKLQVLGDIFRENLNAIKIGNKKVDLIFLIDASSSVGVENFQSEIKFVRKLLSDFQVSFNTTRVAVVTFSNVNSVITNVDQISNPTMENTKCLLLNKQLPAIKFTGGGTFTLGGFLVAESILQKSRRDSKKVIFLITDGYSNGGNPVAIAKELRRQHFVTIFTIGIRNGNAKELFELASQPGQVYSYLLDSFKEFENLARKALHSDLASDAYIEKNDISLCNHLCTESTISCCDENANCSCGTVSGQYSCVCNLGYYGSGLINSCNVCPNGTYADGYNFCKPCPDINHVTYKIPALNVSDCECKIGYKLDKDGKCTVITCPDFKAPKNGYFVKKSECNNVLNNACGVRCKVGYTLEGDSIRLCQTNATWSGVKPTCKVKHCNALRPPKNGNVTCFNEDGDPIDLKSNQTNFPIDTQCKFQCNTGFTQIGSKKRYCLPIAKWDGLNTYCRTVKCPPLPKPQFGNYVPKNCSTHKSGFGTNCTLECLPGFKYVSQEVPYRICSNKFGRWSGGALTNVCQDVEPPYLKCPSNVTIETIRDENFGYVLPEIMAEFEIRDNSNLNLTIWTKPAMELITTFKFKIGKTMVTYFGMDAFQNTGNCTFFVQVLDRQPPTIENCIDPPVFLSSDNNVTDITWDGPTVLDNSRKNVTVFKSHHFGAFPYGTTMVTYTATDLWNNTNTCRINITVQRQICEAIPNPDFGQSICKGRNNGMDCIITCDEGYSYIINDQFESEENFKVQDNYTEISCDQNKFIDLKESGCSVIEVPIAIEESATLEVHTDLCENTSLSQQFQKELSNNIKNNCNINDVTCEIENIEFNCTEEAKREEEEEKTNQIRAKRDLLNTPAKIIHKVRRKRTKIRIKFLINSELKEFTKIRHLSNDKFAQIQKHFRQVDAFVNRKNTVLGVSANADFFVNIKLDQVVAVCRNGSVSKKNKCVKCPKGTFHNTTRGSCQSCPIGFYNHKFGQVQCDQCPPLTSTRRINSKTRHNCTDICGPGTYARKREVKFHTKRQKPSYNINPISLSPYCSKCEIGYYQPDFGKTECIKCPDDYTTLSYSSKSQSDCLPNIIKQCQNNRSCHNGTCNAIENDYYSCECDNNYFGSFCEIRFNYCLSSPCQNNAVCINDESFPFNYTCQCLDGFYGKNCEQEICRYKECKNGGTCVRVDNEEYCNCKENYNGEYCELVESYCVNNFCENNSTCAELTGDYRCECKGGYIGRRCSYLPCDQVPCGHNNAICYNLNFEQNSTKDSYRCECPYGYRGRNCSEKINFCESQPCLNKGICINDNDSELGFKCVCVAPYTGFKCQTKLESDYNLHFTRSGTTDFIKIPGPSYNLLEVSICLWLETDDNLNYGTMISYANEDSDNAFTITDYNGIVLYVNNEFQVSNIYLNDGQWHFLCVTWDSNNGIFVIYVDGISKESGKYLANGTQIKGNGTFVIGQEQDSPGGKFSQAESFIGKLTHLDIWDRILTSQEIEHLFITCNPYYGNVLYWGEFQNFINGNIQREVSSLCSYNCSNPEPILNGYVNVKSDAVYSCRKGFRLVVNHNEYEEYTRKCKKTGEWTNIEEAVCKITQCKYPAYFANGIIGGSTHYEYGDILIYTCNMNYTLYGNSTLECQDDGKWSNPPPYCLGPQCPSVEQPGNSVMTTFNNPSTIPKNTYDMGTLLEFKCVPGTHLVGDSKISCLSTGKWNGSVPECIDDITTTEIVTTEIPTTEVPTTEKPIECNRSALVKSPKNGYFITDGGISSIFPVGSKIEFKCNAGFTFEFESGQTAFTECLENRNWSIPNPICKGETCKTPIQPVLMELVTKNSVTDEEGNFLVNQIISFNCKEGYRGFGKSSIRCLKGGNWQRIQLRCVRVSCQSPVIPAGAQIIKGESFLFQDIVKVECPDTSTFEIECFANKTWLPNISC